MKCEKCGKFHPDKLEVELNRVTGEATIVETRTKNHKVVWQLADAVAHVLFTVIERATRLEQELAEMPTDLKKEMPLSVAEALLLQGASLDQIADEFEQEPLKERELN